MTTLQQMLFAYEANLPQLLEQELWTGQSVKAPGLRIDRYWHKTAAGDRLYLHQILPNPDERPYLHAHSQATAVHVLGGGDYELGFSIDGQVHVRSIHPHAFYYEMITDTIQHSIRVLSEPVYSIMLWTEFAGVKHDDRILTPECGRIGALELRLLLKKYFMLFSE